MSSRRAVPFLVAGVTGVLSGIYIFKPLFDQSNSNQAGPNLDTPSPSRSNDATHVVSGKIAPSDA
ncbi:hypothetical protein C8Q79DRAFT_937060 [Trametes meyenii]|nr:hypothetical protein C8Q79DRAFT_937060 [Trametes meyenii]